jgi:hypothetical protein
MFVIDMKISEHIVVKIKSKARFLSLIKQEKIERKRDVPLRYTAKKPNVLLKLFLKMTNAKHSK